MTKLDKKARSEKAAEILRTIENEELAKVSGGLFQPSCPPPPPPCNGCGLRSGGLEQAAL
jgi:hypothetical protein